LSLRSDYVFCFRMSNTFFGIFRDSFLSFNKHFYITHYYRHKRSELSLCRKMPTFSFIEKFFFQKSWLSFFEFLIFAEQRFTYLWMNRTISLVSVFQKCRRNKYLVFQTWKNEFVCTGIFWPSLSMTKSTTWNGFFW